MANARVRALRTFATGSRRIRKGDEAEVSVTSAEALQARGIVEVLGMTDKGPDNTKPESPSSTKVVGEGDTMKYECGTCGESFDSQRGLTSHTAQKHK